MTVTLDIWDWALIVFLLAAVWLSGFFAGLPDNAPSPKPRGPLDDPTFAAALEMIELEAKAQELRWQETAPVTVPIPALANVMREIEAVAEWAWWAREPDEEDGAQA